MLSTEMLQRQKIQSYRILTEGIGWWTVSIVSIIETFLQLYSVNRFVLLTSSSIRINCNGICNLPSAECEWKRLTAYFTCCLYWRSNVLSMRSLAAITSQVEPPGFVATLRLKLRGQMKSKKYDIGFFVGEIFQSISQQIQCIVWYPCVMHILGIRKHVTEQVCNWQDLLLPVSSNTLLSEAMETSVKITRMALNMIRRPSFGWAGCEKVKTLKECMNWW